MVTAITVALSVGIQILAISILIMIGGMIIYGIKSRRSY